MDLPQNWAELAVNTHVQAKISWGVKVDFLVLIYVFDFTNAHLVTFQRGIWSGLDVQAEFLDVISQKQLLLQGHIKFNLS